MGIFVLPFTLSSESELHRVNFETTVDYNSGCTMSHMSSVCVHFTIMIGGPESIDLIFVRSYLLISGQLFDLLFLILGITPDFISSSLVTISTPSLLIISCLLSVAALGSYAYYLHLTFRRRSW